MKSFPWLLATTALLSSCSSNDSSDQVVSQSYVHKYGFGVSEEEWQQRDREGQVVTLLKNGVKISKSYENGQLHGVTTYSFPQSDLIEKALTYDQGILLKETLFDEAGMPIQEEMYETEGRLLLTLWDEKGSPLSIEELEGEKVVEGKYYTPEHELEAKIDQGFGERVKRDRKGELISRDKIERGVVAERITYHPNGQIHTISHYEGGKLHGEQRKYTSLGKPLLQLSWDHGVLDGTKVVYRNGYKIAEIPYTKGLKEGLELHYDDLGNLTAEIPWSQDRKHGCAKFYSEEITESEWFYEGQSVTAKKFETLEEREKMIAEMLPAETGLEEASQGL